MTKEIEFLQAQQGEKLNTLEAEIVELERLLKCKKDEFDKLNRGRIIQNDNKTHNDKYEVLLRNTMQIYNEGLSRRQFLIEAQSGFNLGSVLNGNTFGENIIQESWAYELCNKLTQFDNVYTTPNIFYHLNKVTMAPVIHELDPKMVAECNYYKNANLFFGFLSKPGEDLIETPNEVAKYQQFLNERRETKTSLFIFSYNVNPTFDKVLEYVNDTLVKRNKLIIIHSLYFRQNDRKAAIELLIKCAKFSEADIKRIKENIKS